MTWHPDTPLEYRGQIVTGDCRELAKAIPDESCDLVLCDPVYWQIDDYRWLAEVAARILKSGGSVIAQAGSEYRFEAEASMRQSPLTPRPLIAEVYAGATAQMWKHRTLTGWKPHIWMSKGQRTGEWVFDRTYGGGVGKAAHEWGDSWRFFAEYVSRLCPVNGVVFDPFTGGGTVPAVCKMLGRDFIAFEVVPDVAERARQRLATTQPPLFVHQAEQLELGV